MFAIGRLFSVWRVVMACRVKSGKLLDFVRSIGVEVAEGVCDLSCLDGFDIERTEDDAVYFGIGLAFDCLKYDPAAKIFYCRLEVKNDEGEEELRVFMQFGLDEDDAIRRIMEKL